MTNKLSQEEYQDLISKLAGEVLENTFQGGNDEERYAEAYDPVMEKVSSKLGKGKQIASGVAGKGKQVAGGAAGKAKEMGGRYTDFVRGNLAPRSRVDTGLGEVTQRRRPSKKEIAKGLAALGIPVGAVAGGAYAAGAGEGEDRGKEEKSAEEYLQEASLIKQAAEEAYQEAQILEESAIEVLAELGYFDEYQ